MITQTGEFINTQQLGPRRFDWVFLLINVIGWGCVAIGLLKMGGVL